MKQTAVGILGALALGVASFSPPAQAQRVEQGELQSGDQQLESGEYMDVYSLQGQQGQRVVLTLMSSDFDTFLILLSPSGQDTQNDDDEGNTSQSRIEATLNETGDWRVVVTSYRAGETGRYTLRMDGAGGGGMVAAAPGGKPPRGGAPAPAAAPMGGGPQTVQGTLAQGDEQLSSGEFIDVYPFQGVPGGRARIDLQSNAFDTYLIVRAPDGEQTDNDDAVSGQTNRSTVELTTTAGEYTVIVTSYRSGETGPYTLTMDLGGGAAAPAAGRGPLGGMGGGKPPTPAPSPAMGGGGGPRMERGRLERGDETLDGGEYIDIYTFEGRQGQQVVIDLMSDEFDTYLLLRGPNQQSEDNDDHEGSQRQSRIEVTLQESGTFSIGVTSYQGGETGAYALRIDLRG